MTAERDQMRELLKKRNNRLYSKPNKLLATKLIYLDIIKVFHCKIEDIDYYYVFDNDKKYYIVSVKDGKTDNVITISDNIEEDRKFYEENREDVSDYKIYSEMKIRIMDLKKESL